MQQSGSSETPTSRSTPPALVTDPPTDPGDPCPEGCELGPLSPASRADCAEAIRISAAQAIKNPQSHPCNGDEVLFQEAQLPGGAPNSFVDRYIASFTKGLPHDDDGEVDPSAYCLLLKALASGDPRCFARVPMGCPPDSPEPPLCPEGPGRMFENPQAAFAFDLQGADSHALVMSPAPEFSSPAEIAEMAELYWMALARDVPFTRYTTDPLIGAAAADLQQYNTQYNGGALQVNIPVDAPMLFRGALPGDQVGPYVSQFLLRDVPYGAQFISSRIRTVLPRIDYMTSFSDWLAVQRGCDRDQSACDPVPRFIRNGRDLGQFVHVDFEFNAFLNAGLLLLSGREPRRRCEAVPGLGIEFEDCLPYVNPRAPCVEQARLSAKALNQLGISTFGPEHLVSLLLEVTSRALKAVWFQKWAVHRRLRPEEFGGRVHKNLRDPADLLHQYPFDAANYAQLQQDVLPRIVAYNERQNQNRLLPASEEGTYLLPMAYAEGSPIHPAYGAGHATVAGACGTILKAFFREQNLLLGPVVASDDGLSVVAYEGQDRDQLTVGGEINKLVSNISLGRNFAGVHWRTDYTESIRLGEAVAISLLCDQRNTFNEEYAFRFTRFDGTPIRIRPGDGVCPEDDPGGNCGRRRRPLCEGEAQHDCDGLA
jgi:hypothetical protein